ncbi:hypothetical protein GCM10011490_06000 [Pseudoclavibacter endophyticus]|uniref:DUF58 domain-containing protein n=1 Tax=Pseudoclavibacter endophyticus TaxID=1778590 RepID=A0A6H9WTY5_9MICO|nr:DUF58 domain-containing protein [Pseudoclavibacter endophyticus]KAB1649904.1 DUF58 domain-containing protein [Pseudoclavibacter endophyticus]GGA58835.1 hypothetical protein GCM10011490_06000 [Pseudoclavibacter endophyticus]
MTDSLLTRVKSKMFLHSRRRVLHLLDGQYASMLRGRSMDFDDLREYVAGDEIKDIDWKATARTGGRPLVKRYVAERKHRVLFAVDRGRNLRARAAGGGEKRDVAITAMGVLGYLALRHGDEVGLITGDEHDVSQLPFRGSQRALERALHAVYDSSSIDGPRSDIVGLLERVRRTVSRKLFLVVIADELPWDERLEALVRRLAAQHDFVWLQVGDADPRTRGDGGERAYDVDSGWSMPSFIADDPMITREYEYARAKQQLHMEDVFDRSAVSYTRLESEDQVIAALLRLLKERSHVRH